jgi:hypothetical protein
MSKNTLTLHSKDIGYYVECTFEDDGNLIITGSDDDWVMIEAENVPELLVWIKTERGEHE